MILDDSIIDFDQGTENSTVQMPKIAVVDELARTHYD